MKGPRWEGELAPSERAERKEAGKFQHAEVRTLDTIGKVVEALEKARNQNKFLEGRPNLLVVYSSLLFISPTVLPRNMLEPRILKTLKTIPSVGGLLMIYVICREGTIYYERLFVKNRFANSGSELPQHVEKILHINAAE